jgi:hypothetical protein
MVYGTYNYSYWGLSTIKHHWGASPMADVSFPAIFTNG